MDDREFQRRADRSVARLFQMLGAASESHEFDADLNNGALTVEFEDPPARFVVSPNAPVRQIWVSANVKSFKLDWNDAADDFTLGGQALPALMAEQISRHLGEDVAL